MKPTLIMTAGSTFGVCALAGVLGLLSMPQSAAVADEAEAPETISLTGLIRDFKEKTAPGGHPDFENKPNLGFAMYCSNIGSTLGADGKPAWLGSGKKLITQYKDAQNHPIAPNLYNASLGDIAGSWGSASTGGVNSAATFAQWFTDTPGMNISIPLTLTLNRQADGTYVFDDKLDPQYSSLGGFFPIENMGFGNPGGTPNRNFHFTFELNTEFTYLAAENQMFKFIGDDDVWVYIDGKLVIDLGGVHSAKEQYVELNRLGLQDGKTYKLDFFFAERHRTQSNFRIQTNLSLYTSNIPSITSAFD
jgi:fibro-slime domain-containing protein